LSCAPALLSEKPNTVQPTCAGTTRQWVTETERAKTVQPNGSLTALYHVSLAEQRLLERQAEASIRFQHLAGGV
jgi:hypothetical protein